MYWTFVALVAEPFSKTLVDASTSPAHATIVAHSFVHIVCVIMLLFRVNGMCQDVRWLAAELAPSVNFTHITGDPLSSIVTSHTLIPLFPFFTDPYSNLPGSLPTYCCWWQEPSWNESAGTGVEWVGGGAGSCDALATKRSHRSGYTFKALRYREVSKWVSK